jgi:hypothetical protein
MTAESRRNEIMLNHPNAVSEKDLACSEPSYRETFGYRRSSFRLSTDGAPLVVACSSAHAYNQ